MAELRIFSYLPNPRIWKATIAARHCGLELDLRGARPDELADWLWDFEARPLSDADRQNTALARQSRTGFAGTLFKSDAFLAAHPFGTVPAAFSPDGSAGIFESNSIARAVARLDRQDTGLYGRDPYEASRIDSFLDASLVFARDGQKYLLSLSGGSVDAAIHETARQAFETYLSGIEQALAPRRAFLVGDALTLADICFVAEICSFAREIVHQDRLAEKSLKAIFDNGATHFYPRALAHFENLRLQPAFAPDVEPFWEKITARRPTP